MIPINIKSLTLSFLIGCSALAGAFELEPEFTSLFDGKTLAGWETTGGTGEFEVVDGTIRGFGKEVKGNTFLITQKNYSDFEFRFQMKFNDLSGNSGVMFRAGFKNPEKKDRVTGYQCEHDNKERNWTAGIYDEARRGWLVPDKKDAEQSKEFTEQGTRLFKTDDWNDIVIRCEGKQVKIWLNGELRAEYTEENDKLKTADGFFGLQVHGGKSCDVSWRNLRIKELAAK
ncbi:3-keto-disaccharide hydrolase [Persicirhabdus sediminis]|uniref:DUF1080 domain-containing protein n=1 Tax=Persicirhabdus sediminis TaxID=454144 RepID=A0A8J7SIZ2_9BACT|nr:DUF1080 domain-containing protein [Persicirhabdus sediminis]MBK1790979.1 DUF1080 domain-containing protein [Persicirhabdus sediminis]